MSTPPRILDVHLGLARRLVERFPELAEALAAAGASIVVFEVPRSLDEDNPFLERAREALRRREASLPEDAGTPIFVCQCALSQVWTLIHPPHADPSADDTLPLDLHPRRGLYGGTIALGEGGLMVFDAAGHRISPWDGARDALLALLPRLQSGA